MAAKRKTKRSNCPPFVFLNNKTLWSEEWLGLLPSRQIIYLYIKSRYTSFNNGKIYFPYSDYQDQFDKSTFYDSLSDLVAGGWIRRKKKGSKQRFYYLYELPGEHDELLKPRKPFAAVNKDLLSHQAWKDLSHISKIHYLMLKCSYTGKDKNTLTLPYSKLKGICSPATSSKSRKELITNNWIKKVDKDNGLFGNPTCYRLTAFYDWWPKRLPYGR